MNNRILPIVSALAVICHIATGTCSAQDLVLAEKQLTHNPDTDYYPDWSPDGKYITADVATNKNKDNDNVWLLPVNGGDHIVLTDMPGREGNPKYSPDGTMIAFMSHQRETRIIFIIAVSNRKMVQIAEYEGFNANPRWSPGGKRMAIASDKSGNFDIWVMDLNIPAIKKRLGRQ